MKQIVAVAMLTAGLLNPIGAQETPLYWAIVNNDALAAWNLTEPRGTESIIPGPAELAWAIRRGASEVFDVLSYRGAPADAIDDSGRNLLFDVSIQGRLDLFRKIAAAGARLEQVDREGWSLAHAGAQSSHPEMTVYLLQRGVPPVQRSDLGVTPLMLACAAGLEQNALELLSWGANPADEDYLGHTVLWYAHTGGNAALQAVLEQELTAVPESSPSDAAPLP
ncbi:MAG: ankyrin repeat domain-containing protein [Spirochaetales bacterium]